MLPVGLVQLHFRPGSHFADLDTPVKQFLFNLRETPLFTCPENGDGCILAGPHLDNPEKAVVIICYGRAGDNSTVKAALDPPSPIYAPITPYLASAPRADVFSFFIQPHAQDRKCVQELALIRIPEYETSSEEESGLDDEEDSDESDDENPSSRIRHCILRDISSSSSSSSSSFSSWVDVHDEISANNNDDDDDDVNEIPADNNNNDNNDNADNTANNDAANNTANADTSNPPCHSARRFFAPTSPSSSSSSSEELFSSSSSSSSPSPFALPLAQLDTFFQSALTGNAHRGHGDLASHRSGSSTARPEEGGAVLHVWTWADADAMARFKDPGRPNCYDGVQRRALERGVRDGVSEGEGGEGDDKWQDAWGFVPVVERLRECGAEVEVVAVRLRRFSFETGRFDEDGGDDGE
ncbi:hypothetical protein SLS55_006768 [Diplodia seriata]|uniref:Uncharacterized protein n=1 Tax=Diplodia seriata TaxID=420778 RepID=A0ABR3CF42_9PEZI